MMRSSASTPIDPRSSFPVRDPHNADSPRGASGLIVSTYERTAALLVTALILVGSIVTILFALWLTTRVWVRPTALEPQLIEPLVGGGSGALDGRELLDPLDEELDQFTEPAIEETLDSVAEIVASDPTDVTQPKPDPPGQGTGRGSGIGPGMGEGEGDTIPRWDRWVFKYGATSLDAYARQLDYFGVELGATGGGSSTIDYAYQLTRPKPLRRTGTADDRIYLLWDKNARLREADEELLRRAGIPLKGRLILQFLPPKLEQLCAQLEDAKLRERRLTLDAVRRTVFAVLPSSTGYRLEVVEIQKRGS